MEGGGEREREGEKRELEGEGMREMEGEEKEEAGAGERAEQEREETGRKVRQAVPPPWRAARGGGVGVLGRVGEGQVEGHLAHQPHTAHCSAVCVACFPVPFL